MMKGKPRSASAVLMFIVVCALILPVRAEDLRSDVSDGRGRAELETEVTDSGGPSLDRAVEPERPVSRLDDGAVRVDGGRSAAVVTGGIVDAIGDVMDIFRLSPYPDYSRDVTVSGSIVRLVVPLWLIGSPSEFYCYGGAYDADGWVDWVPNAETLQWTEGSTSHAEDPIDESLVGEEDVTDLRVRQLDTTHIEFELELRGEAQEERDDLAYEFAVGSSPDTGWGEPVEWWLQVLPTGDGGWRSSVHAGSEEFFWHSTDYEDIVTAMAGVLPDNDLVLMMSVAGSIPPLPYEDEGEPWFYWKLDVDSDPFTGQTGGADMDVVVRVNRDTGWEGVLREWNGTSFEDIGTVYFSVSGYESSLYAVVDIEDLGELPGRWRSGTDVHVVGEGSEQFWARADLAPDSPLWWVEEDWVPHLKILFVPLRWQGTQEEFDTEADTQVDLFLRDIPLGSCPQKVLVEKLDIAEQNFDDWDCSGVWGIGAFELWRIRRHVSNLGLEPADYDVVVGLVENTPCHPSKGENNGTDTVWIDTSHNHALAHELGHIFGLQDEYCSTQAGSNDERCNDGDGQSDGAVTGDVNWLDAAMPFDCPPDGSPDSRGVPCCNFNDEHDCSVVDYDICCDGNRNSAGGRATMSYADAGDPTKRGFDDHSIAHLSALPQLNCSSTTDVLAPRSASGMTSEDTIMEVSLLVHQDDSVEENLLAFTNGRPTSDSILQHQSGDYSLMILDPSGEVLWSQSFALYFDYQGPVELDVDYSGVTCDARHVSYRIGYAQGMNTLVLYHGENLIFSEPQLVHRVYMPSILRGQ